MTGVAVVGEALVDVLPGGGDTLVGRPGGSPANVALALARLDVPARFLGRTSTDRWGQRLRDHLAADGVDLTGAPTGDEPTPIAFVSLDADGAATYRFLWEGTADRVLAPSDLPTDLGDGALHVGSVACLLDPGAGTIEDLVRREHDRRVVSFDPNIRPALASDADEARHRLLTLAANAQVVKASDEDLAFLVPDADPDEAAWSLLDNDTTQLVALTRGAAGALVVTPRFQVPIAAAPAGPVVDTIGAGDTFMAGLLAGLAELDLLETERIKTVDADAARAIGRLASAAAGVVVSRPGCDPPRRGDLPAPG